MREDRIGGDERCLFHGCLGEKQAVERVTAPPGQVSDGDGVLAGNVEFAKSSGEQSMTKARRVDLEIRSLQAGFN